MSPGKTMNSVFHRSYQGPLKAVILDWAGTTVDYACAPVMGFVGFVWSSRALFNKVIIINNLARKHYITLSSGHGASWSSKLHPHFT
jgi:hypothetical protein